MSVLTPLIATFRPQAWINDTAADLAEGAARFDATAQLLAMELEAIRKFRENDYDSDRLAGSLQQANNHCGPFEVDVDIDDWLEKNGIECGRHELTQEQLDELRRRFAAITPSEEVVVSPGLTWDQLADKLAEMSQADRRKQVRFREPYDDRQMLDVNTLAYDTEGPYLLD